MSVLNWRVHVLYKETLNTTNLNVKVVVNLKRKGSLNEANKIS